VLEIALGTLPRFENSQNAEIGVHPLQLHKSERDYQNLWDATALREGWMVKAEEEKSKAPCAALVLRKATVIVLVIGGRPSEITPTI
jgi:hypothetical protein